MKETEAETETEGGKLDETKRIGTQAGSASAAAFYVSFADIFRLIKDKSKCPPPRSYGHKRAANLKMRLQM